MRQIVKKCLPWLSLALRAYLGLVFILAAVYKIANPQAFALSIATYQILPDPLINLLAILLPWLEVIAGLCLILGFWSRASALLVSGMLVVFIVAIAIALSKDLQISCGCFASSDAAEEISWLTLTRDLGWLIGSCLVIVLGYGRLGLDGWFLRPTSNRAT